MKFELLKNVDQVEINEKKEAWHEAVGLTDETSEQLASLIDDQFQIVAKDCEANPDKESVGSLPSIIAVLSKVTPEQVLCLAGMAVQDMIQEAIADAALEKHKQGLIEKLFAGVKPQAEA